MRGQQKRITERLINRGDLLTFFSKLFLEVVFLFIGDLNCMRTPLLVALFDLTRSVNSDE